ncbi:helix-turn-helix domain-containing protein [Glaesserella parasuis]|uniref:IclR family transcriptional regulator n=1 Tax=Glaesserella parasuis HPS10 TaxID=1450514 RepID=A0A836Z0T9_GLAPU|nr:helix-turn-helix domain-containing protein [Glaesserella parasuis]KDB48252.1 IclR family transcriptional regulator [Glaesserella parasuis HPS10]MCT8540897.1 helix-turn-helix domain-containing protein [Glaesserella parasuis]MCT8563184.1 helix-turn-helix domain-containing protein [Glaesserella parasuis]MCT8589493.1 helix-turn-helix domain-containing protein [Glaesserella parasuis]MCT8627925.1 helix-turn-helix domain-containing protein [Glaesserella parasuis]
MSEKINSTRRALRILKALQGRSVIGLSNKELADRLNESPVNITRSLQALIAEGLVVKQEETGRFVLGIQMLQIAVTHQRDTEKIQARMAEMGQRVNAGAF